MDPAHPNHAVPGKRVRHTILPSMMLAADGALELSFGCVGANMQPQGQVQILVNLIDRGFDLQQALDAPRVRALDGRRVSVGRHPDPGFPDALAALGHQVVAGEDVPRSFEGCAQAIAIAGEAPVRRLGPAAGRHGGAALAAGRITGQPLAIHPEIAAATS